MATDDLETRARKAIIRIQETVSDIEAVLYDLGMKLCHLIKSRNDYHRDYDRNGYRR